MPSAKSRRSISSQPPGDDMPMTFDTKDSAPAGVAVGEEQRFCSLRCCTYAGRLADDARQNLHVHLPRRVDPKQVRPVVAQPRL